MNERSLKRILYVEDEPDIQTVAQIALQEFGGFIVEIAGSGREGLAKAEADPPDLILLDMMMPGMSGLTTLDHLRSNAKTAAIPVIFMTAKVQSHEISKYKSLGALDVITKPFDPVTLAETVIGIFETSRGDCVHGKSGQDGQGA